MKDDDAAAQAKLAGDQAVCLDARRARRSR